MKVLTIKQPWAYIIATGIKDIENRTWKCPEKYVGKRVLIHASAKPQEYYPFAVMNFEQEKYFWEISGKIFGNDKNAQEIIKYMLNNINVSSIIGSVEIVDCVINHTSVWAEKTNLPEQLSNECIWNWVLANPILFDEPILGVKGKLGFWNYEV